MALKFYNTLTRKVEDFVPQDFKEVKLYTCGPTVYAFPQIGNWRTFVFEDLLRRTLEYNGYKVNHVMNVTDVGHLTGDNLGDADLGEDRMEKAAKKENKTAWDIAKEYLDDFIVTRQWLNILPPTHLPRATEEIDSQIKLIQKLEKNGFTYATNLGVYFDVSKFADYGKLGGQKLIDKRSASRDELKEDGDKKHPFDFALWKFSQPEDKRQMEWDSPWGRGFPGWHIECSAMSMKYLGETLDIHTGGVDHIAIHHTNEIAQSEGATGKIFSRFWIHGEFLTVEGGRMGKSLGNAYTLHELIAKGFEPLALRYFYLGANYRTVLNFTWEGLQAASNALNKLRSKIKAESGKVNLDYKKDFLSAVNDDLNFPRALAVVWKMLDDKNLSEEEKSATVLDFDKVLGLGLKLESKKGREENIPEGIQKLIEKREILRKEKKFAEADEVRQNILDLGFNIEDKSNGISISKK